MLLNLLLLAVALAAVTALLLYRRRVRRRIDDLTVYLEHLNSGHENVLTRGNDEFSLLEDGLYKTVGELRIAKENAQLERCQQADNLADIAHQLKTPLTSMSLMAQLLRESICGDEQGTDCLNRLEHQLARLQQLLSSLLLMSRLDAGAIAFEPVPTEAAALLARATEPIAEVLSGRGQRLVFTGDQAITLSCDPAWTAEALLNLVKNCSEHSPQGGDITIAVEQNPLYLQLTIEDRGTGFDPDELQKVFRRFYRGKNAAKDSIGIGLALSKSIIERQNGMLRAENRPGGGARFVVRFY